MITHIRLKNFKCFLDESFDISPLTLFTGINGMGKSSVIQSLLLLKQSFESTLLQTQNKVDLFNYSFTDLESAENLSNLNAYPKNVNIIIESDLTGSHEWSIDASNPKEKILNAKYSGNGGFEKEHLFNKNFIYLTAERFGPRKSYSRKVERVFNTILGIQGELTPPYLFKAINNNQSIGIKNLKHSSIESVQLYENLNAWLSDILGRPIVAKVTEENEQNVNLSFSIRGTQGGNFSALQVGFGCSFSLPVILAPLIARPGDLLIIENPEAHLHPSAQSKIGKLLSIAAQNGVQVIIETHSDHVLNGIRVAVKQKKLDCNKTQIHYFKNQKNSSVNEEYKMSFAIEEDGGIERWPEGFFDEWDNMLDELIDFK